MYISESVQGKKWGSWCQSYANVVSHMRTKNYSNNEQLLLVNISVLYFWACQEELQIKLSHTFVITLLYFGYWISVFRLTLALFLKLSTRFNRYWNTWEFSSGNPRDTTSKRQFCTFVRRFNVDHFLGSWQKVCSLEVLKWKNRFRTWVSQKLKQFIRCRAVFKMLLNFKCKNWC